MSVRRRLELKWDLPLSDLSNNLHTTPHLAMQAPLCIVLAQQADTYWTAEDDDGIDVRFGVTNGEESSAPYGIQRVKVHPSHKIQDLIQSLHSRSIYDGSTMDDNVSTLILYSDTEQAAQHTSFAVQLIYSETKDQTVKMVLSYNPTNVNETAIEWLAVHIRTALESIFASQSAQVRDINILSKDEKTLLLDSWSGLEKRHESDFLPCIHHYVEEQARLYPDRVALQYLQGVSITYGELDRRAEELASYLISRDVGAGQVVPLFFEKSVEIIVAMIGVLKSRAAYCPLDPEHPAARTDTIVTSLNANLILTSSTLLDNIRSRLNDSVQCFAVDQLNREAVALDSHKLHGSGTADDVCYVLFTSGTTGIPKGVVVPHRAVVTSVIDGPESNKNLMKSESLRTLFFSNYAFDYTVWDIYMTLASGGCLCIAPQSVMMDDLAGTINIFNVNFLETTPAVIALIEPDDVPTLCTLYSGGEPLTKAVRDKWSSRVTLGNVYGPTETTVCCTFCIVTSSSDPSIIGKPFGQNVVYVLDRRMQPVTIGAVGQLWVSGNQVSNGYVGQSDLTSKVFVSDPFRGGCYKMYATGDLVQWTTEGWLRCLGRADSQCKVRGQRIETAEIEATLVQDPRVCRALVAKRKATSGHEDLVAFVMPCPRYGQDSSRIVKDLMDVVTAKLPRYMVPAVIFPVKEFPLTSSGKVDRRNLLASIADLSVGEAVIGNKDEQTFTEPETDAQRRIRSAWSQILVLPENRISVDTNFLQLGGDSISVIRLSSLLRRQGLLLSSTDISLHPTIREQAALLISRDKISDNAMPVSPYKPFSLLPQHPKSEILTSLEAFGINRDDVDDVLPCTQTMSGLIALSAHNPQSYFVQYVYEKRGGIDAQRLHRAWNKAITDIPILRTAFFIPEISGVKDALQIVFRADKAVVPWVYQKHSSRADQEAALQEYLTSDLETGFQVGKIPTRLAFFDGPEVSMCAWSIHHSQYDGWAYPLILTAVEAAYNNHSGIMKSSITTPFSRYVEWVQKQDADEGLAFWKKELEDISILSWPKVPHDVDRVASDRLESDIWSANGLREFCERHSFTASSVIRAALAIVLGLHGDTEDVLFGVVSSGRSATVDGIETIIGPCIATIPCRVILNRGQPLKNLIQNINRKAIEAARFDYIGLKDIAKQTSASHSRDLFQVLLTYQNLPDLDNDENCFIGKNVKGHVMEMNYSLGVTVFPVQGGLKFEFEPDSRWVTAEELKWFTGHLFTALDGIVASDATSTDITIDDLTLISEEEREFLNTIGRGLQPDPQLAEQRFVFDLIEAQAAKNPDAIALEYGEEERMTYGEFATRTNRAAHGLQQRGVGPETIVPILFDKTVNQVQAVVAIISVLKAGGAFVPLDASWPVDRLKSCIRQAKASFYICDTNAPSVVSLLDTPSTTVRQLLDAHPATKPHNPSLTPNNLAYIIFTSGSTGEPKGVMIEHRNIIAYLANGNTVYPLRTTKRLLHFSPFSFDQGLGDIYCALSTGATLILMSMDAMLADMGKVLNDMRVDYTVLTPTIAQLISEGEFPYLKSLLVGGEKLTPGLVERWKGKLFFMDDYGPTECTVSCCGMIFNSSISVQAGVIGRSFGDTRAYIVDKKMNLVPVGQVGELCISGNQVGRGYLNLPEVTAKAFMTDPFDPTLRMYRTGDRARWTSDGFIEYLGREQDGQVKLRGLRIDTGEIEAALMKVADTFAAVELLELDGKPHLTAFISRTVATDANQTVSLQHSDSVDAVRAWGTDLTQACEATIPVYARPTLWIPIETMPQNNNSKLDRKKLRAFFKSVEPDTIRKQWRELGLASGSGVEYVPAQSPSEIKIHQFWAEHLGIQEPISITSPFMVVGGDSISAVQVVAGLRKTGLDITIREFYQNDSIKALASLLDERMPSAQAEDRVNDVPNPEQSTKPDDEKEHERNAPATNKSSSKFKMPKWLSKVKRGLKSAFVRCTPTRTEAFDDVAIEKEKRQAAYAQKINATAHLSPNEDHSNLFLIQRAPKPAKLFLLHDGSGFANDYLSFGPLGRDVFGIANPTTSLAALQKEFPAFQHYVDRYTESIIALCGAEKEGVFLGGWSFGGMVAVEVGHRLQAAGINVKGVILIDSFNMAGWTKRDTSGNTTPTNADTPLSSHQFAQLHQQHIDTVILPTYHPNENTPFPTLLIRAENGLGDEGSEYAIRLSKGVQRNFWNIKDLEVRTIRGTGHFDIIQSGEHRELVSDLCSEWCWRVESKGRSANC